MKDKMHTVKAMGRRFEREDENMTQMSEQEEAIFFKLGDKNAYIPTGKTVIEYELSKLMTPEGERILAEGIYLKNGTPHSRYLVMRMRCAVFHVRLAAHVSNGLKSRIHPVVGRI